MKAEECAIDAVRALGADVVRDSTVDDWQRLAREATGGEGPHVVIESDWEPGPGGVS